MFYVHVLISSFLNHNLSSFLVILFSFPGSIQNPSAWSDKKLRSKLFSKPQAAYYYYYTYENYQIESSIFLHAVFHVFDVNLRKIRCSKAKTPLQIRQNVTDQSRVSS